MNINYLILRNLKKNIKNYYLYVFALIFSVALYFAFVTLQYDPAMDEIKGSVKGAAGMATASVLLVVIVAIFLLYANTIFIKRRSKEIGLFQLIGLTKGKIFRILSSENLILYFGSMLVGIFVGFSCSRLLLMILFKVMDVEAEASLNFSIRALLQTVIVFAAVYLLIMLMNYTFIKRQTILSLFRVTSSTENKIRKMPVTEIIMGLLGIGLILFGYYLSSQLFGGKFMKMEELFLAMSTILGSVILGTYLFYKGSVSLIFNAIRKSKGGYLSLNEVLSLSSIMFRMKSNALLLTIITTVSALAIGLLSLSYISYYSVDQSAKQHVPNHFTVFEKEDAPKFTQALQKKNIAYTETHREVVRVSADLTQLVNKEEVKKGNAIMVIPVVSEKSVEGMDVSPGETRLTGYSDAAMRYLSMKKTGEVEFKGKKESVKLNLVDLSKDSVVSDYFSNGLLTAIVDDKQFEQLVKDQDPKLQLKTSTYIGIDIVDAHSLEHANQIFNDMGLDKKGSSQRDSVSELKQMMGMTMFVVGFLGLTFLITSGCILYFKQMDEGEEEKPSYTILRKLGFTQGNLTRGVQFKQMFNFGIPLVIGLSHSYFAVQSGWFLFGTELWTPMFIVMLVYTALYSIFGFLSVLFYKRVIKESL